MLPLTATVTDYGVLKQNYAPIENPVTDEDAANRNDYVSDVAGMTHTIVKAWRTALGKASSPLNDPASNIDDAVWGNATGVRAVCTRSATGTYVYTWPASVTDALGVSRAVSFRRAWAVGEHDGSSFNYTLNAMVTAANVVTVYVRTAALALIDPVGMPITVFAV